MASRRSAARHPLALAAAVPLTVALVAALSACSPLSLFANWGAPTPTRSATQTAEAGPSESPSPQKLPSGTPSPGCVDRVISAPGTYHLDYCQNLTIAGSDIIVTASHLGTLTVLGDSLQVSAQTIGALEIQGDLNNIQTTDDIQSLKLMGSRNMITCHGSMTTATVTGDDNTVLVDGGVDGDVQNNGQRNAIGGQP